MEKYLTETPFRTVEPVKSRSIGDLDAFVLGRAAGKSVLNIGAGGNMSLYLPGRRELSLHLRMGDVATRLTGVDIDRHEIDHAAHHGVEIERADCQDMSLGRTFDLILMVDVIEHLERPGDALRCARDHLAPDGELVIATPNATFVGGFLDSLFGRDPGVFHDHVATYQPEHMAVLAERTGWRVGEVYFFTLMNRMTRGNVLKSNILRAIGKITPRLSNSFLCVLKPGR